MNEGDEIEIYERNGIICLEPVAVYPKKYLEELETEYTEVKEKFSVGGQPVFDNAEALFEHLESE